MRCVKQPTRRLDSSVKIARLHLKLFNHLLLGCLINPSLQHPSRFCFSQKVFIGDSVLPLGWHVKHELASMLIHKQRKFINFRRVRTHPRKHIRRMRNQMKKTKVSQDRRTILQRIPDNHARNRINIQLAYATPKLGSINVVAADLNHLLIIKKLQNLNNNRLNRPRIILKRTERFTKKIIEALLSVHKISRNRSQNMTPQNTLHRQLRPDALRLRQHITFHQIITFILSISDKNRLTKLIISWPTRTTTHLLVLN